MTLKFADWTPDKFAIEFIETVPERIKGEETYESTTDGKTNSMIITCLITY